MDIWTTHHLETGSYLWRLGPLGLWVTRRSDEYGIAVEHSLDDETSLSFAECAEPPGHLEWERWAVPPERPDLRLTPVMADRPLVLRPQSPLRIPPGASATFYAQIPVWVKVELVTDKTEELLCEVPSIILSNTWFGDDTMHGILCYAMRTHARRDRKALNAVPHRAACQIDVSNESHDDLHVQRLCLHVEHFSLYWHQNRLWSSAVDVRHRGERDGTRLEYTETLPGEGDRGERLSEPRQPVRGGLLHHSIGGLPIPSFLKFDL